MWFFWSVVAYFLNALAVLIDKSLFHTKQVRKPASYVVVICALGMLAWVLAPLGLSRLTLLGWILSTVAGFSFTAALLLFFTCLQQAEVSRVTSFIGAWSPIFVFAISFLFFNERLSVLEVVAFILLVTGGFLMAGGKKGLTSDILLMSLLSAVGFAVFYTVSKATFDEVGFISGLIWIRVTAFVFSLFLLFIPSTWQALRYNSQAGPKAKLAFFGGQVSSALSALLINYAISLGSVTLINAMQGLQYVFLLGLVATLSFNRPELLKEELSGHILLRKIIAILLIAGGLVFISSAAV